MEFLYHKTNVDLDSGQTIEDRSINEITGRERRRMCKSGPRKLTAAFTCEAAGETSPHKWKCLDCQHEGLLKAPLTCRACGRINRFEPITLRDITAVHKEEDGKAKEHGKAQGQPRGRGQDIG